MFQFGFKTIFLLTFVLCKLISTLTSRTIFTFLHKCNTQLQHFMVQDCAQEKYFIFIHHFCTQKMNLSNLNLNLTTHLITNGKSKQFCKSLNFPLQQKTMQASSFIYGNLRNFLIHTLHDRLRMVLKIKNFKPYLNLTT